MMELEERIDRLEALMAQSQLMYQGLIVEMREFKNEMRLETKEFKNHTQTTMDNFRTHTQNTIDNLSRELQKDREKFARELQADRKHFTKELNTKFEKLTRMMGTIVEDIVIPNIEFLAEKYFNLKHGNLLPKPKVYNANNQQKEFDTIAVYPDKVIWVSAKLTAKPEYANEFNEELQTKEIFDYFPYYKGKEIIPIFASFHSPENVLTYLTRHKIYAMASKEDTMDILNFDEIR